MEDVPRRTVGSRRSGTTGQAIKKGTYARGREPKGPGASARTLCDHPGVPRRRSASPGLAAALLIALVATGCGTSVPSPSAAPTAAPTVQTAGPTGTPETPADVYARIERQVEAIRGLPAKVTVDPVILDQAALDAALRANFDKDNPAAAIAATERVDRALGLIPADASLKELQLQLLSGQVVGFYDPETKTMSVKSTSGAIGVAQQITFAHEYDHALQDQQFDLSKLGIDAHDQGDRSLARLALVEGDATLVMTQWASTALTPAELLQYLAQSDIAGQTAALAKLPAAMRDQLLFPYTTGLTFVQGLQRKGGWEEVDRAFARLPDSTEQVLHPEKYAAHEAPVAVPVPGRPRDPARCRLDDRAPGHVRRVRAADLAPVRRRARCGHCGRRGRRAGAATASCSSPTAPRSRWRSRPSGTPRPMRPRSPRPPARPGPGCRDRPR